MAPSPRPTQQRDWPFIEDVDLVEVENTKALIERADALLKAQDDGLKAMEARMSSLFGQSITLASAAIAATATAFAALNTQTGNALSSPSPPWALAWVAHSLAVLSAFWLVAVAISASSMLSQMWSVSGIQPIDLYTKTILTAPSNSVRLAIARSLQNSIDSNFVTTSLYARRLAWVIATFASGPLVTAAVALWLARPPWAAFAGAAAVLTVNAWLVWFLYRSTSPPPA